MSLTETRTKLLSGSEVCPPGPSSKFTLYYYIQYRSSISNLHSLQIRSFNGIFWFLPFSISKLCALILNLINMFLLKLSKSRQDSYAKLFLKSLYACNLFYLKLILLQLYYLSVYSFQKPYINKTKNLVCKHWYHT
jgi:hypothetical protein